MFLLPFYNKRMYMYVKDTFSRMLKRILERPDVKSVLTCL